MDKNDDGVEGNGEGENGENQHTQSKYYWSYEATRLLMELMRNYVQDLNQPATRRQAFKSLCTELSNQGFDFTLDAVNNKWKSLIRCYKINKERFSKSGRTGCRFEFYDQMDELWAIIPWECKKKRKKNDEPTSDQDEEVEDESTSKRSRREAAREQRHREKMEIEQAKLDAAKKMIAIERDKINLIKKLLDKK